MALPVVNSSRYSTKLPSTGLDIEFRPYLVKEEKIMMIALESKDNKAILRAMKDVAQACILSDINIDSVTSFDLEWIFLQLRSKSVGESTQVRLKCKEEECNSQTEVNIKLDEVSLTEIAENKVVELTDTIGVVLKYPTLVDVEGFDEKSLNTVDGGFDLVIKCLETIYDENNAYSVVEESHEEVKDFLDSLSTAQFKKIIDWVSNTPSLVKNVEWNCTGCGKPNELELRGLQSFFT